MIMRALCSVHSPKSKQKFISVYTYGKRMNTGHIVLAELTVN